MSNTVHSIKKEVRNQPISAKKSQKKCDFYSRNLILGLELDFIEKVEPLI